MELAGRSRAWPSGYQPSRGALPPVPHAIPLLENGAVLLATLEFHSMGLAQGKEAQGLGRPGVPPSCPTRQDNLLWKPTSHSYAPGMATP